MSVRAEQTKVVSVWSSRFVLKAFGIGDFLAGMPDCGYGSGIQSASGILSFYPVYQRVKLSKSCTFASSFQTAIILRYLPTGPIVGLVAQWGPCTCYFSSLIHTKRVIPFGVGFSLLFIY